MKPGVNFFLPLCASLRGSWIFWVDLNLIFFSPIRCSLYSSPKQPNSRKHKRNKRAVWTKNFSGFQFSFSGILVISDNRITDYLLQTITSYKKNNKSMCLIEKEITWISVLCEITADITRPGRGFETRPSCDLLKPHKSAFILRSLLMKCTF